jgi:hypothetical protein
MTFHQLPGKRQHCVWRGAERPIKPFCSLLLLVVIISGMLFTGVCGLTEPRQPIMAYRMGGGAPGKCQGTGDGVQSPSVQTSSAWT